MKVLLINGSPHANGCVFTALSEFAGQLQKYGRPGESNLFSFRWGINRSGVVSPVVDAAAHREGCVYSPKTR